MAFSGGEKTRELEVIDSCGKRNTGTAVRFLPDPQYFDSLNFSIPRLQHVLRAKAVLCPGLRVTFLDEKKNEKEEWYYEDGLTDYLLGATEGFTTIPAEPFTGSFSGSNEAVDWAVQWLPEGGELITESYVNLIPTARAVPT
jgi:topoisomerase-4 subunit B